MKSLLYIMNQAPYSSNHDFEMLESAMVGAIFDLKINLLYREEGVWSLISEQHGEQVNTRTYSKLLSALPTYEIDRVYFCKQSIQDRHINLKDLVPNASGLSLHEQKQLVAEQHIVMTGPK